MAVRNDEIDTGALDLLLDKVCRDRGYDFRGYRPSTPIRRLGRRLLPAGVNTHLDYMRVTLQEQVLNLLYDSPAVSGYPVPGEVETLPNSLGEKYECLDEKARVYKKTAITGKTPSPCIIE